MKQKRTVIKGLTKLSSLPFHFHDLSILKVQETEGLWVKQYTTVSAGHIEVVLESSGINFFLEIE